MAPERVRIEMKSLPRELRLRLVTLLVPFVVYLAGVVLLGDWIIDDAGISFAYARNVAGGHGFVSQPGRVPVEGASDFLWVILLVPFFVLRLFDPIVAPKVIGAALVLASFALLQRTFARRTASPYPGLSATLLLAASPPIVIWTASGLENGLTLLLLTALFSRAIERPPRWALHAGLLAALLAMTHPEGLIYAAFGPAIALMDLAIALFSKAPRKTREIGLELRSFALGFGGLFGPFLFYRVSEFGLPFPHTYYAKRIHLSPWERLAEMAHDPGAVATKLTALLRGTFGPPGPYLAALLVLAAAALLARRKLSREAGTSLLLAAIAVAGYLFIDEDWMGEYRFGTGAILASTIALAAVAADAARALRASEQPSSKQPLSARLAGALGRAAEQRLAPAIVTAGVAVASIALFFPRIVTFASNPPTPFLDVDRNFAAKLDAYADRLGIAEGSMLLADVGAPLYRSRLTVYDAAGLCEPDVIRTIKQGTPMWLDRHPAFYDWVFDRIHPTFIATHHFWTRVTAFDQDPRFARDYVPIDAYEDAYVVRVYGRSLRSGVFVRRDALPDFTRLASLRDYHSPPRLDPLAVRLEEALFEQAPSDDDDAVARLRAEADRALRERDDPNRAATLLGRAIALRPADADAVFARAGALDAAMRTDEARADWIRLLDLSPATGYGTFARARLAGRLPSAPR